MTTPSNNASTGRFQLSIRQKIQYSVSFFSLMVILVTGITFAWSANRQFHNSTLNEISILASVLAGNSQAAVTFNDPESATRILSALKDNPNVLSATIYRNQEVFSVFPDDAEPLPLMKNTSTVWYEAPYYYSNQLIQVNGKTLGTLVMKSQLIKLESFWENMVYVISGLLVSILGLAYLTSHWLRKHVTLPVRSLSEWASEVCSTKSFDARAIKHSDDEIGRLTDNLNNMLAELSKQESILSLNRSLEDEISVRKQTEQELISMRNQAEQANRAKSMFLANMSHEIRTPMNAIIGFVDVVLEHDLTETQRKHLSTVRQSAKDLHNLLNEILDVAKMEEGKLELEQLPFSVRNVVSHVMKTLHFKATDKGLQMIERISDGVPEYFLGDSLRLNQVLMNLIGNAIKFTEMGSIMVAVDVLETGELRFLVRDTGIGIPKDKVDHIFDSFSQADASTNRKYGGTGLGTTISKQLVELMGGKIWVESQEGVGSSFYFTVCLQETEQPDHVQEHDFTPARWHSSDSLEVLVAEDMQQNADLLRIRLESLGHRMTHAVNGARAVEQVQKQAFDLILMDIQMPEMDGLEATRKIRQLKQGKSIPIIALTASVMHEDRHACTEAGMDGFVKKPIVFNELFEEMARVLHEGFEVPDRETPKVDNIEGITDSPLIDFKQGIATWGDTNTFIENLKQFSVTCNEKLSQFEFAIEHNQEDELHELLHAYRGVTGNLGLVHLYETLQQTSAELHEKGIYSLRLKLDNLRSCFESTMAAINNLESRNKHHSIYESEVYLSQSEVLEQVMVLRQQLAGGELDENLFKQIVAQFSLLKVPQEKVDAFCRAVDDFEFESAGHVLEEIHSFLSEEGHHESDRLQPKNTSR
ncbi:ATP-binding protein [Litoribrevibacter albus]|uniref:Sensory/regulatory protein RpfC n=1 Tax=Litoribrevibacter albus TaxID=1473156 RepID=A0AA37S8J7_9GAMM|nr:ATP-binding protein [Litoribrevibacter albus]GLQ30428.1 hypothetical protein GCM10007876_09060 [Litoribrevibacter albus]